jgi:hypothetical protein
VRNSAGSCLVLEAEQKACCLKNRFLPALWKSRYVQSFSFFLGFALFLSLCGAVWRRARGARAEVTVSAKVLSILFFGGMGYWLWMAPDPRFGIPYLVGLSAALLARSLNPLPQRIVFSFCVLGLLVSGGLWTRRLYAFEIASSYPSHYWPRIPTVQTREKEVNGYGAMQEPIRGYSCGWDLFPCRVPRLDSWVTYSSLWGRGYFSHLRTDSL